MYLNPMISRSKGNEKKFYEACSSGDIDVVKSISESDKNFNNYRVNTSSIWALKNNQIDVFNFLVTITDENLYDYALSSLVQNGKTEQSMWLIKKGAKVTHSTLLESARNNMFDFIRFLKNNGQNLNDYDHTALNMASLQGYVQLTEFLIEEAGDINSGLVTSFTWTCANKMEDIVRMYLDKGFSLNLLNKYEYDSFILLLLRENSLDETIEIFNDYNINIFEYFDEKTALRCISGKFPEKAVELAIKNKSCSNYMLNELLLSGHEKEALTLLNIGFHPIDESMHNNKERGGGDSFYTESPGKHSQCMNVIILTYLRMTGDTPLKALKNISENQSDMLKPLINRYLRTSKSATIDKYLKKAPLWQSEILAA
jgi:hypothetical protein